MRIEQLLSSNHNSTIIDNEGNHDLESISQHVSAASQLLTHVAPHHQTVALIADNSATFVTGLFTILSYGACAVIIDPFLQENAVLSMLETTKTSMICFSGQMARHLITENYCKFRAYTLYCLDDMSLRVSGTAIPPAEYLVDNKDLALILFSSGTTGLAKGIALSHQAIFSNMAAISDYLKPTFDDRFYIAKSMVHSSTLTGELLLALSTGAQLVVRNPRLPASALFRYIADDRPSIICMPPALLHFFAIHENHSDCLSSVHTLHISGSMVNRRDMEIIRRRYPDIRLINAYGLTEAGPRVSQANIALMTKVTTIGKPIKGVRLQVRRADGSRCDSSEIGEFYVHTKGLMAGYVQSGRLYSDCIDSGWLATGDLGFRDEDGDFFITGRADDMVITGSHNVLPHEIEQVIMQVNGISDCIVFAVDDDLLGQRLVCAYTHNALSDGERQNIPQSIRRICMEQLAPYQMPKHFYLWSYIPHNDNGKKSRLLAKRKYLGDN